MVKLFPRLTIILCGSLFFAPIAGAETVKVFAAGSLKAALTEIISAANLKDVEIAPTFGPAGALRERIEKGEAADLLLSADMGGPEKLASEGKTLLPPIAFARNTMCLYGNKDLGLTPENALDEMLSDKMKLATSTPLVDPSGDYAVAVFKRADASRPGAGKILSDKALHLFGTPNAIKLAPNHTPLGSLFVNKQADLLLIFCSADKAVTSEVPDIVAVPLPATLEPTPIYGMALLTTEPGAMQLALFTLSKQGQAIMSAHGLKPLLTDPASK